MLAEILKRDGPFDGVIAFSQGTILAAILASLLEGQTRVDAFHRASQISPAIMPYPDTFINLRHPPFKFGILYAGRVGTTRYSDWLYEDPLIDTPFCHFVGKWDPMVDHEERDAVLAKLSGSKESRTIVHVGGHFVPVNDEMVGHVVDFIAKCSNSTTSDSSDSAEDSAYEAIK
jgi:dihydrofolate reductase